MSQNTLPQVETAESQTHDIIADIARNLLDSWYDEYPTSNAFGCDYTAPNGTPNGTWFFGRSNGADGAESDLGVDYINHRFPDPDGRGEDVEYIYGKYGWCDVNELLDVAPLLRQAFEEGVGRDLIY